MKKFYLRPKRDESCESKRRRKQANYLGINRILTVFFAPFYFFSCLSSSSRIRVRGGGGRGGRTRANSVCLTKNMVKIGAFPNATRTNKIWKNLAVDLKDQRRRSVWVGQSKSPKENKNSLNMSTACLLRKIDAE